MLSDDDINKFMAIYRINCKEDEKYNKELEDSYKSQGFKSLEEYNLYCKKVEDYIYIKYVQEIEEFLRLYKGGYLFR